MLALALETAINHVLQLDIESPTRVKKLEGRLLKVDLEGLAITLFFTFSTVLLLLVTALSLIFHLLLLKVTTDKQHFVHTTLCIYAL